MVALSELLGSLTDYFVIESPSQVETRNAYLYAMGLGLISLCIMFVHGVGFHLTLLVGMMTRIMMTAASYSKVMATTVESKAVYACISDTVTESDHNKSVNSRSYCELGI